MISVKEVYATPHLTQYGSLVELTVANYPFGPDHVKTDPAASTAPKSAPIVPGKGGLEEDVAPPLEDLIPSPEDKGSSGDDPSTGGISTPPAPISGTEDPAEKDGSEVVAPPLEDLAPSPEDKGSSGDDPSTGGISTPPASISGSIKGPPSGTDDPAEKDDSEVVAPPPPPSLEGLAPSPEGKNSAGAGSPAPKTEETKDDAPAPKVEEKKDAPQTAAALPAMGGTALPAILLFGRRLWRRLWRRPESE